MDAVWSTIASCCSFTQVAFVLEQRHTQRAWTYLTRSGAFALKK